MLILLKKVSKRASQNPCWIKTILVYVRSVRWSVRSYSTELQYEDASEDEVVYGDQGINTEEYEKATYGDLMKPKAKRRMRLSARLPNELTIV